MQQRLTPRALGACLILLAVITPSRAEQSYSDAVGEDSPVAYWRFEKGGLKSDVSQDAGLKPGETAGDLALKQPGPRPPAFPDFDKANAAMTLDGKPGWVRIADPGDKSIFDFTNGDSITIEAWVNPKRVADGQQVYIIGKGRTQNKGFAAHNQNWALRLRGVDGAAGVSFLFRSAAKHADDSLNWHRWTSRGVIGANSGWHHVAVTYTFGKPETIRAHIDGEVIPGGWDMGGPTTDAPVVDNDEVWIGSSMGGNPSSTFVGGIDEVAVYRKALSAERIARRYRFEGTRQVVDAHVSKKAADLPADKVVYEIVENVPDGKTWAFEPAAASEAFTSPHLALIDLPRKYSKQAIAVDRTNPFMLRAAARVTVEQGEYRILLRAKNAARLYIGDKLVAQTGFINSNASGHERVPDLAENSEPGVHPLAAGHQEKLITTTLAAGEHVFSVETIIGGKGMRPELGDFVIAVAAKGEPLQVLSPVDSSAAVLLRDEHWQRFAAATRDWMDELNAQLRRDAGRDEAAYWRKRHELARTHIDSKAVPQPPNVPAAAPVHNAIDRFLAARITEAGGDLPSHDDLADDWSFIRRVYLDTVGLIPSHEAAQAFVADENPDKRQRLIDSLLADPRWADNWVGYWQDVLAENPGLLKPKLNNTGPFRYWIRESLLDNKPADRFATELILMQGSTLGGGPAGFAIASENDLPMAAKAHVIGQAFLAVNMKCARCHDAPHHPVDQKDLFNLAAMLDRKTIAVPKASVVNRPADELARMIITVSLKPGEKIEPAWPFDKLAPGDVPDGVLRNPKDDRERFAAILTSPRNERFAQVIVNRLWKRFMGFGIVEPVDDWDMAKPSHPRLLAWLGDELVRSGYDMKHVSRLILSSHAYQRRVGVSADEAPKPQERLFAAQARRRMTAEQVVDSLFAAAGKPLRSEMLTLDPEGRRPISTFLNFGVPRRAWEFTSLANERDRPALALPMAQAIVDVLGAFGWRETRQDPITTRDQTATVLQPLMIANGQAPHRIAQLSDDGELVEMALKQRPLEELVDAVFIRLLTRPPTTDERQLFVELLRDGYDKRRIPDAPLVYRNPARHAVSWANHLNAEATKIKLGLEEAARRGDPPTQRLTEDWRLRMEDMAWALMNSPEFLFVP